MDTKTKIIIALSLACLILGYFANRPRIETKIETKVEIREVVKYLTSNSQITGATNASVTPGGTVVSGANLTITQTTTITERVKERETTTDKTTYATDQYFVFASYGTNGVVGVGGLRRVFGPFYAGVGVETKIPPILTSDGGMVGRVYIGVSF